MELKRKLKAYFHSAAVKTLAALTVLSSCAFLRIKNKIPENNSKPQNEVVEQPPADLNKVPMNEALRKGWCKDIYSFVDKASHVTDTVILNKDNYNKRLCSAVYIPSEDLVHIKYFIPDTTDADPQTAQAIIQTVRLRNNELFWKSNKAHEYQHRQTHKSKVFLSEVCAEDYARLCQHNEIVSNVSNLLFEREVYKKACEEQYIYNKDSLVNLISPRFYAYREAVRKGEVNPFSINPQEQEYENYLIVKTVYNWWIDREQEVNVHISKRRLDKFMSKTPQALRRRNEAAYEEALNNCYTFIKDGKLVTLNYFYHNPLKFDLTKPYPFTQLMKNMPTEIADVELRPEICQFINENRMKAYYKNQEKEQVIYLGKKTQRNR